MTREAFLQLARLLDEAAFLVDDGLVVAANEPVGQLVGCSAAQLTGRTAAQLFADEPARVEEALRRFGRSTDLVPAALCLRRRDGAAVPCALRGARLEARSDAPLFVRAARRDGSGNTFALLTSQVDELTREVKLRRDVEEERARALSRERQARADTQRAYAALERRDAELRLITDSLPALVAYVDLDRRYRFVNGAYERWFATDRAAVLGARVEEVLGEATFALVRPHMDAALSGRTATFEAFVSYRTLGPRWVQCVYVPDLDRDGRVRGFVSLVHDVTERKLAEEALKATEAELRTAVAARDQLIWVASHELKTPLNALSLQLEGLAKFSSAVADDPRARKRIDGARQQVARFGRLVNDLLDVSRITSGRLVLEPEPLDLVELLRELVEREREAAARAACELLLDVPATPVVGSFDRVRLEQAVLNLLSNAVKFGAGKPVSLSLEADDAKVTIRVADRGIGIAPEDQPRVFGRFERAVSAQQFGGLGLGLWIVREIVEASGGAVRLESAPGQGARFEVELPRQGPGARQAGDAPGPQCRSISCSSASTFSGLDR